MNLIDRLDRRFSRYAIKNLTVALIIGQAMCMLAAMAQYNLVENLQLIPAKVLAGEVWRVLTFIIVMEPPQSGLGMIFIFFYFWLFWLMGNALDAEWGTFRFNLYVLIGLILTFAVSWLSPDQPTTSGYVYTSIFLAFAYLYPDFEILMFFILPVKVKWLALLTWLFNALMLIGGTMPQRFMVLAGVANFGIFFGPEIVRKLAGKRRRMAMDAEVAARREEAFHTCAACGATDKSHPRSEFRYMPVQGGTRCICMDCLEQQGESGGE